MSDLKRDGEGFVIITVKDLLDYLQRFPADLRVVLDKDGWMEEEFEHKNDVLKLIHNRGIFQRFDDVLFINN